ncbi:retrotransposon protein, putative, ty1-copia subclass [Tanacetum coccineum]
MVTTISHIVNYLPLGIPGTMYGFLSSGRGGGNHKKKDGGKSGKSQHAKLDDNSTFPKLSDLAAPVRYNLGSHEEQIVSDNRKGTTPMHESDVSIDANDPSTMNANVVNSGNCVDATHVDQNLTQLDRNVGGSTVSVSSVGRDTNGPSLANSVTKEPILTVNTKGPGSFAKLVTGEPSRKTTNFRTLLWPAGNEADVAIFLESVRAISERFPNSVYGFFWENVLLIPSKDGMDAMLENNPWFIRNTLLILKKWTIDANLLKEDVANVPVWVKLHTVPITAFSDDGLSNTATKLDTPLMLDSDTSTMCTESWGMLSFTRAMIELQADVELKDTILVVVPKLIGEGFSMCTIRVEYEWKPPKCSTCKVFGHVLDDFPKQVISDVLKNLKNPRQVVRGVQVGPKLGFKPAKQVYQLVSKKNGANTSGKKKQAGLTRQEVSNSNPFDALNPVENGDDLGTNEGNSKLNDKGPIMAQMLDEKLVLEDDDVKPLKKVDSPVNSDIDSEVKDKTTMNDDYDPYDDDMYDDHDISENLQAICDD